MASQEEDNKLECISNVNKEQERYFLNVYKKHEFILNNKNELFENKVESLIDVWKSVGELNLTQFDIRHVIQIMDWAKLHALNIVLTAEWNAFKASHQAKLLQQIEKAQTELLKLNSGFATRCKKLADVVKNPWEDTVLMTLMKTKDAEIGSEEIEFFCVETAYVISVRLKKLCESQCEDLALNLVTAFMNCNKLSKTRNFSLNATETQMWFIFDIYIALLYKFQEKQKIVILLKELTFEEGLHLVKRFAKKRVKISKIWKNCHRVAVLAIQMYISQAVVKYTDDLKDLLENYIEIYISLCNTEHLLQDFTISIRRISNLADAAGLYIFCAVIQKKAGRTLKPFVIEMYIRALTTDMNDLERQKDAKETEKVAAITSRLAEAFCNLAHFLDEHVKVARECVLTAFSLEPTKERLQNIETLAKRSGYQVLDTGQEWKCKLHPPVLPSDDITWICPECGDWMCKPQLNIPLKINMALNEALQNSVLGISEALCDDLVVCLSNPRYQILSWFLPWDDLHRLCIMYFQDPQTTKNFVTELKFVDIDYSIFQGIKREPLDELAGIERGYEQYLDQDFVSDEETSSVSGDSMSQDSRPYSLGSDGAGEGPCLPVLLSQPKSDPNTLKSLRMFRPNLKRVRTNETIDNLPEKLRKGESGAANLNQSQTGSSNFKNPVKMAANKATLNSYLHGIPTNLPTLNTNNKDSHSKNVKAATLSPLGGQVAYKEMKSIQVLLQPLKESQLPKNQALKPYNQSKGTIAETTRKELMLKLLSKPSLSGFKENNSCKAAKNTKTPDSSPPIEELKMLIKSCTKTDKEPKSLPSTTPVTETKLPQPSNLETAQASPPPNMDMLTNTTNLQKIQSQSPTNPEHQQIKSPSMDWLPSTLCARLKCSQPNITPTMELQNAVLKEENPQADKTANTSFHNEDKVSPKIDKLTVSPPTLDRSQNSTETKSPALSSNQSNLKELPLISQNLVIGPLVQQSLDRTETKSSSNMEGAQSLNSEKISSDKIQTNLSLVEPSKLQKEKIQINLDKTQTALPLPLKPSIYPILEKVLAQPERINHKHSPLLEKELTSSNVKATPFTSNRPLDKASPCLEKILLATPPQLEKVKLSQDRRQNYLSTAAEKTQLKSEKMAIDHSQSMRNLHQLKPRISDNPQSIPVRTEIKAHLENSKPPMLPKLEKAQKQSEIFVQKKVEPAMVTNSLAERKQLSSDLIKTPHPSEQICQTREKHQLAISLEQMEFKLCPSPDKLQTPLRLAGSSSLNIESSSEPCPPNSSSDNYPLEDNKKSKNGPQNKENRVDSSISNQPEKLKKYQKSDNSGCILDKLGIKCNNTGMSGGNVQTEGTTSSVFENGKSDSLERPYQVMSKNCLGVIDDGIFSDLTDNKLEDLFFHNNNDYSSFVKDVNMTENCSDEELPKNFNLTENIRTYTKKSTKKLPIVNKDCVKTPTGDDKLDVCKNVNSSNSFQKPHSIVQKPQTNCKELKVVLYRLPAINMKNGRCAQLTGDMNIKKQCDRGRTPPRSVRKRKSIDKSENKIDVAPNRVQNHKLSPLQDINLRIPFKENSKSCCDDLTKPKTSFEEFMTPRVLLERIQVDKKKYARSVLANVPGLNDYQMIRPTNVNQIVNVVQVAGGRQTQSVPIQTTQTSTQISPHIQRIGQPRVAEQKPEHSNSVPSTTTLTSTTTMAKTTTSQPSTLINILSQQIIRPVTTQSNTNRRQTPMINILSQQIIRPSVTQKTVCDATNATTENNQAKPAVTTEQPINNQTNNVTKNINAGVKTTNPTTTGQGSTILQFICKSSLPKFQQAFGKSVYQNTSETPSPPTTAVETTNISVDSKKNITKAVPVNVQPIQGSVIYSRQVPVGQTISLIPQGATTRQVFRIATSNPEQLSLVKDSVIHSKMSALLAAALQASTKNPEVEQCITEEKVTLNRPTLVQNARIVKPVQLQIPPNVVRTTSQSNLSSTTLEQLREFDMVYKQVKERSSSTVPTETSNSPSDNQEVTQQRISVTYVNQLPKYAQLSPVVVVSTYNSLQPAASPALSVTSQGSSSPCVTPAPTPTLPKIATKTSKGKTLKTTPNNTTAKASPIPKPQQKPQEDEHTTQRIFDILAEYAEQLRNSPDLNNKPAPRRRSNPPTNPSQNSKRKKSSSGKKSGQANNSIDIDPDDITVGSEDSSGGGIMQLSVTDDEQSQAATNTPESTENSSPSSSRQLILTESGTCGNQSRNLIIADSSVGEALKIPNTAVIVPGSYIMPVSMVKGGQQIAVVSGGSKILATVPARSGQNMLLFQSFTNQNRKGAISAVKYSAIQPITGISSQSLAGVSAQPPVILPSNSVATAVALGQPLTLKKLNDDRDSNELLLTISQPKNDSNNPNDLPQPDSSTSVSSDSNDVKMDDHTLQSDNSNEKIFQTYQKSVITNSVATSVIATTSTTGIKEDQHHSQTIINMNLTPDGIKGAPKPNERMQSVLVTACSSNGPMLSHTTPRYRKNADAGRTNNNDLPNKEFLHNGEKTSNNEQKTYRNSTVYYVNKTKKNCVEAQKIDSELQKQAAIERELRLQKSLSEECEDLGVDEPSTSDLFPEADLLFDSNHSPSFDQSSQDIIKRMPQTNETKEEVKAAMNLFSDDENSSSLRTDLFEYVEFQTVETALDYQARQLMNGNLTGNESGSSGAEDNTLLAKCPTMSEVTLNSPISPELYTESSSLNKYKFKYSNRKRGERMKQNDLRGEVVSSSEDTLGNAELARINCEDDNFKLVHVAITKTDIVKDEQKCELHCDEDLDSPSGRGARRSVRKLCSCCNGSQDGNLSRKRPHSSRPHTPATPHKKAFLNKKR